MVYKNPTLGWGKVSPKTTSQRDALYHKCGNKCFLKPPHSFPICPGRKKISCKVHCGAVLSAFRRARQYGHKKIASKVIRVAKREKCSNIRLAKVTSRKSNWRKTGRRGTRPRLGGWSTKNGSSHSWTFQGRKYSN